MHLKKVTVGSGEKKRRYYQIVESYRRVRDGKPTIRTVCSLGSLTDLEAENFREVLRANKQGRRLAQSEAGVFSSCIVNKNLQYLDIAAVLHLWQDLGISDLVSASASNSATDIAFERILAALIVHRCVDPDSKLAAVRWLPTTSLPKLLQIPVEKFNNSRLHRALAELDRLAPELQRRLSGRVAARLPGGRFIALFLDASDVWFVGSGPDLAARGRTKEGMFKEKIGVAVLCDKDGFPLCWRTFPGDTHEARPMIALLRDFAGSPGSDSVPVVVDRALGSARFVAELDDMGVSFVAAVPRTEYSAYGFSAPAGLEGLDENSTEAQVGQALEGSGFVPDEKPGRFVADLGIRSRTRTGPPSKDLSRSAHVMRLATAVLSARGTGPNRTPLTTLATRFNCSKGYISKLLKLEGLTEPIRQALLLGRAPTASSKELVELAALPATEQPDAFDALRTRQGTPLRPFEAAGALPDLQVRAIAGFNVEQFLRQRKHAAERVQEIEKKVDDLNRRLEASSGSRTKSSVLAEIGSSLRRRKLLTVYEPEVERRDSVWHVKLIRNEEAWKARRATDGLFLLVAQQFLPGSALELVQQYRSREVIERDFRDVKSVVELRPVFHRTDPKVRAHVSLCMLALFVDREIERRLAKAGQPMSARRALSELRTCHLNELTFTEESPALFSLTRPNAQQQQIIRALGAEHLIDPDLVATSLSDT